MGTGASEVQFQAGGGRLPLIMRLSARVLVGMLFALCAAASPAQTANVESVAPLSGGAVWYNNWGMGPYASPAAACNAYTCGICGSLTYVGTVPSSGGYAALGFRDCQKIYQPTGQTILSGSVYPVSNAVCPTPAINPAEPYTFNPLTSLCERPVQQSCPAHSSGTYPSNCVCDTGYKVDPVTQASCVPACPVDPLKPLDSTVQPYEDNLIDMANETKNTQDGAACIVREARARHLSPRIESGYRPPAYQTHIREVYDKWQLLKNNNDAVCADTKRKVKVEFKKHSPFAYQPGNTSHHSSGRAVDIHLSDYTNADTIAAGCNNMSRPVTNDISHFESPR